jgi:hypothetical protein
MERCIDRYEDAKRYLLILIRYVLVLFSIVISFYSNAQKREYAPYWLLSEKERRAIDIEQFQKYGIVSLDSLSIEIIRVELNSRQQIFKKADSVDVIYQPSNYLIKPLIADAENNIGIYSVKFNRSHSDIYLIYKDSGRVVFSKSYDPEKLVMSTLDFLKFHESVFSEQSKIQVWRSLSDFMLKYYYKEEYPYLD